MVRAPLRTPTSPALAVRGSSSQVHDVAAPAPAPHLRASPSGQPAAPIYGEPDQLPTAPVPYPIIRELAHAADQAYTQPVGFLADSPAALPAPDVAEPAVQPPASPIEDDVGFGDFDDPFNDPSDSPKDPYALHRLHPELDRTTWNEAPAQADPSRGFPPPRSVPHTPSAPAMASRPRMPGKPATRRAWIVAVSAVCAGGAIAFAFLSITSLRAGRQAPASPPAPVAAPPTIDDVPTTPPASPVASTTASPPPAAAAAAVAPEASAPAAAPVAPAAASSPPAPPAASSEPQPAHPTSSRAHSIAKSVPPAAPAAAKPRPPLETASRPDAGSAGSRPEATEPARPEPVRPDPPARSEGARPDAPPAPEPAKQPARPDHAAVKPGTIDIAATRAAARAQLGPVQQCFERAKMDDATLTGSMLLHITIAGDGSVATIEIARSTLGAPQAEACIRQQISRWHLPAPSGGVAASFSYPLVFE